MRILFFSDQFRPETCAPAASVYDRAKAWVAAGHEVTVITSAPNFPDGKVYTGYSNKWRSVERMDGIRVVRVKTYMTRNQGFIRRTLDFVSYMVSALLFALFERKPDIAISTSPQLFAGVAGVIYSKLRRLPHVLEVRDLWPASILVNTGLKAGLMYRLLEWIELSLYRHSERLIVVTNAFADDMVRRGVPSSKIEIIRNGADLEMFFPRTPDEGLVAELGTKGKFVVGYLGTLGASHGLENILHTAKLLESTDVVFLLVGTGVAKEGLEAKAKELRLKNVIFVPRQPKEAMPLYWSICDAALVHLKDAPVFRTVIPSKLYEAMAMGLPVVYVGPEGEASEIIGNCNVGLVVPPANPAALAQSLLTMMSHSVERGLYADQSARAAQRFSRARQAAAGLAVLQAASARKLVTRVERAGEASTSPSNNGPVV